MSWKKGQFFENLAANYLQNSGYSILERNWHAGIYGELDLICLKDNLLVFVEVKGRDSQEAYFDALNAINKSKAKKLLLSMQLFLEAYTHEGPIRCDLIVVSSRNEHIHHLENIELWDF